MDKDFSTIRRPFLEPIVTPVEAEPEVTSGRDPFLVGFGVSFGAVSIAILWITVFNHKDAIVARLIPKAGESAVEVSEPPRQPSELSVTEAPAELPEAAGIEQSKAAFVGADLTTRVCKFALQVCTTVQDDGVIEFVDLVDAPERKIRKFDADRRIKLIKIRLSRRLFNGEGAFEMFQRFV